MSPCLFFNATTVLVPGCIAHYAVIGKHWLAAQVLDQAASRALYALQMVWNIVRVVGECVLLMGGCAEHLELVLLSICLLLGKTLLDLLNGCQVAGAATA